MDRPASSSRRWTWARRRAGLYGNINGLRHAVPPDASDVYYLVLNDATDGDAGIDDQYTATITGGRR